MYKINTLIPTANGVGVEYDPFGPTSLIPIFTGFAIIDDPDGTRIRRIDSEYFGS